MDAQEARKKTDTARSKKIADYSAKLIDKINGEILRACGDGFDRVGFNIEQEHSIATTAVMESLAARGFRVECKSLNFGTAHQLTISW